MVRNETKQFSALKLRYQFALLWLPLVAGLVLMAVGGSLLISIVAPYFSVNPELALNSQANGGRFFLVLMIVGLILLAGGMIGAYLVTVLAFVSSGAATGVSFNELARGQAYPEHWKKD